jgi:guanylate kinase
MAVKNLFIVISGPSGVGKDTLYRGLAPLTLKDKKLTDAQAMDLAFLNRTVALEDRLDGMIAQDELDQYPSVPELENNEHKSPEAFKEQIKNYRTDFLKKLYPVLPIWVARSDASREKKPGETEDVYRFISPEEFIRKKEEGQYLEWALVYGTYKGTPVQNVREVLDAGKIPIKLVDPQGTKNISEYKGDEFSPILIFLDAPNDVLKERIMKRRRDTQQEIAIRLGEVEKDREILSSIIPPPIYLQNTGTVNETRQEVYRQLVLRGL